MSDRNHADQLFERGSAADAAGRYDEAIACYRELLALTPESAPAWYNLGLVYKRMCRWPESLDCNRRALALDGKEPATIWNTGIAATALGDWRTARDAWSRLGLTFPDGDGFVDLQLGAVPIRISPELHPEVVWCERLDPVRARIRNVPMPESERRFLDVVLNDGEPVGERMWQGRPRAVFNELMLLEPSAYGTYGVTVTAPDADALNALLGRFGDELVAEDWTGSLQMLCKECSEATVEAREAHPHRHEHATEWQRERRLGIAALDDAPVAALLDQWRRDGLRRAVGPLERLL